MTVKVCFAQSCHNVLKPPARKFCSSKCSKSYHNKKYHAQKQGAVYEPEHDGKPVAEPNVQKEEAKYIKNL